jgi:hypothetical protein
MIGGSNNSPVDHFYHQLPPTEIEKTKMGETREEEKEGKRNGGIEKKKETENERKRKVRIENIYRQDYSDKITNVYRCLTSSFTFNY